jgi:hypothetical protein
MMKVVDKKNVTKQKRTAKCIKARLTLISWQLIFISTD